MDMPMNDTIMASLAAIKSRSRDSGFSLYTGFRSVRRNAAKNLRKLHDINSLPDQSQGKTTIALTLDPEVLERLKSRGDNPAAEIRAILHQHLEIPFRDDR